MLRINDILSEIEGNLEPLQLQSEKAKKYLNLRENLKNIEVGLFLYNINQGKSDIEKIVEDENITKEQCDTEETRLERVKILKEQLKGDIDEITNKIENMSNLGFESQKEIEMLNSDINVAKTKILSNKENQERFLQEIQEKNTRLEELEDEQKQKDEKRKNLRQNKEKFTKELEQKQSELDKITQKLTKEALKIEQYKKQVEENLEKKYEKQGDIQEQEINFENYEKRQKQVKQEIQAIISELDNTRMRKEEISKEFYEIESVRNINLNQLEKITKEKEEANQKIKIYQTKLNTISNELRMKQSRQSFLIETEKEKEGYTKSVKTLLNDCESNVALKKGVEGVLANLIDVPEDLQTAIEMSLGMALQNIVTETEQDAKKLVEHLRKNNIGRASFLPITSIKGKKIDNIKGNKSGIIGVASDLIKYNKKYEQIIFNLLGRTVIVDNMDTAIRVSKENLQSFKIVTQEGDIINPSGAITGGSVMKKTVNILGREREIKKLGKEIEGLQQNIANIEKEKEQYEQSIEGILEIAEKLEKELQDNEIVYATGKQKVLSFEEEIQKIEKRLDKFKLAQIKGITKDKATEISESFIENWEVWQIVGFLERFGIGAESAKKVYDLLGIDAISEIEANPYILIDISRGVDFKQIDQMAIKLGVEKENQKRVKSGIKYALIKITYNGHCCTLKENLIEYVKTLLNVNEAVIEDGIINLKVNNEIIIEERDEEE